MRFNDSKSVLLELLVDFSGSTNVTREVVFLSARGNRDIRAFNSVSEIRLLAMYCLYTWAVEMSLKQTLNSVRSMRGIKSRNVNCDKDKLLEYHKNYVEHSSKKHIRTKNLLRVIVLRHSKLSDGHSQVQ